LLNGAFHLVQNDLPATPTPAFARMLRRGLPAFGHHDFPFLPIASSNPLHKALAPDIRTTPIPAEAQ